MSLESRTRLGIEEALQRLVREGALAATGPLPEFSVEAPKNPEHGDLATNAALVLGKRVGMAPRTLAEKLAGVLVPSPLVKSAEVAGPGFVNIRLHDAAFQAEVAEIVAAGTHYGMAPSRSGDRVNVEFVSANPTGPITVAAGRNAIFGDAVATLLGSQGASVTREYYINDFGNQVQLFARSVAAAAKGEPGPEDGYKGAYVQELADWLLREDPKAFDRSVEDLSRTCISWMLSGLPGSSVLRGIRRTLSDLGVHHDVWFSEESLHRWGQVGIALRQLEAKGHLAAQDGAIFFKAKSDGLDDKDRVVKKSDGSYTYFASDIAYHADKLARGYDRLINVLGADHHGYVPRIKNVLDALGLPSGAFEALIYQLVFVLRDGVPVKSSKRAGNVVTMDELMEEIDEAAGRSGAGRDALRFFFLSRSANSNIEFDIELAKKKSLDNPVFYVQYGSARIHSILNKARELSKTTPVPDPFARNLSLSELASLTHPDELAIVRTLSDFPSIVRQAALAREPHKIATYVSDLARAFQSYYTRAKNEDDPVLPKASTMATPQWETTWDFKKTAARLEWLKALRNVYVASLSLLGVSAPEEMHRSEADMDGGLVPAPQRRSTS